MHINRFSILVRLIWLHWKFYFGTNLNPGWFQDKRNIFDAIIFRLTCQEPAILFSWQEIAILFSAGIKSENNYVILDWKNVHCCPRGSCLLTSWGPKWAPTPHNYRYHTTVLFEVFQGGLNWRSMMPRDAIVWDNCIHQMIVWLPPLCDNNTLDLRRGVLVNLRRGFFVTEIALSILLNQTKF